jgi:hypothetical protein
MTCHGGKGQGGSQYEGFWEPIWVYVRVLSFIVHLSDSFFIPRSPPNLDVMDSTGCTTQHTPLTHQHLSSSDSPLLSVSSDRIHNLKFIPSNVILCTNNYYLLIYALYHDAQHTGRFRST